MGNLGWTEIALIAVALLLLFGPRKLPELAKGIGEAVKEFRKSVSGAADDRSELKRIETTEEKHEKSEEKPVG